MTIERIWHNFEKWEDHKNGMYNSRNEVDKVELSRALLIVPYNLFTNMVLVTNKWIFCSEHNLSNTAFNRKAWLGWASCCYCHGATDQETRNAWNLLTAEEKNIANRVALEVIDGWENFYYKVNYA